MVSYSPTFVLVCEQSVCEQKLPKLAKRLTYGHSLDSPLGWSSFLFENEEDA
jgi:hypothetical protein